MERFSVAAAKQTDGGKTAIAGLITTSGFPEEGAGKQQDGGCRELSDSTLPSSGDPLWWMGRYNKPYQPTSQVSLSFGGGPVRQTER